MIPCFFMSSARACRMEVDGWSSGNGRVLRWRTFVTTYEDLIYPQCILSCIAQNGLLWGGWHFSHVHGVDVHIYF
jgi:hypothetical protein